MAQALGTTVRTITGYESETQDVPEARWRLFQLIMTHEVARGSAAIVCVFTSDQQVLDAVSEDTFLGCVPAEPGVAVITSRYIRRDGVVGLHAQRFSMAHNRHVIDAAELWQERQFERSGMGGDRVMLLTYRWLTQRALKAEAEHPELREMKDCIAEANREVDAAAEAPEEVRRAALATLDKAIATLVRRIEEINHPV